MTRMFRNKLLVTSLAMGLLLAPLGSGAWAQEYQRVYDAGAKKYVYVPKNQTIGGKLKQAWRNPVVKKGVIGTGVGIGVAAVRDGSLLKGGLVGAGVGAGWGAMDKSRTMQRKPLLRHVSKGALAGAGVGMSAGGIGALPAAAIGAGVGAVTHYVKTH